MKVSERGSTWNPLRRGNHGRLLHTAVEGYLKVLSEEQTGERLKVLDRIVYPSVVL